MWPRGVPYIWVVVREIFNLFVSFGKYALVRFVSAVTCCDGGFPEGSDVYEATGYILELHQPNVSTAVMFRCKSDHPFAATAKHNNNIDMNSPDWVQVKIQYGYCYRSFCQRLQNLLCVCVWKQVSRCMKAKVRGVEWGQWYVTLPYPWSVVCRAPRLLVRKIGTYHVFVT